VLGNARRAVTTWLGRFWADLKASTDASLLGVLRFLGLLYGPIETGLPIDQALRRALRYRLPHRAGWRHAFGGIAYLLLIVLVVSGVLLAFYYRPSAEEAYPSIQHIVSGITFGWLMRDLHVWGANLLVLAVLVHLGRVFFDASYKPPRETNWLVGVLLLFVIFAFGATGYLLPWDQSAYWTVTEGLDVLARVPIVGGLTVELLRGDPIVSGATLSRFFAVHVILLPWLALGLLMLHFGLVRKHGIAAADRPAADDRPGVRFFPHHLVRSLVVAVLVLAVAITAAVLYPREVGAAANPSRLPGTLPTSWIMADVSHALAYYLGVWGFSAFLLIGLALALLPLFDRRPERRLRRRPIVTALGALFFAGFAVAWVAGRRLRAVPPRAPAVPGVFASPPPAGAPLPPGGAQAAPAETTPPAPVAPPAGGAP
jgi:quinol-cytochrome oxidoreductase complex cytochrome b subunit